MATHSTGPILNKEYSDGLRSWFSNLPMGGAPDLVAYFNDFLFAGNYSATDWVVTETDSAATEVITADELNGALTLTNTAADDDVVQLQSAEEWMKLAVGKRAWFETKLKVSDATQSDFYVGFATTDTSIIAGTTDSCGFRKSDGAAALVSLTETSTTETTNTAATVADATYITLGFYWDGISRVRFYVNRSLTATHTANIPSTNKLALTFTLQNGEAVAKTMIIDYVYVAQER